MSIRSCDQGELEPVLNALELSDRQLLGKYIDLGFEKEYNVYLAAGNPRLVVKLNDGQGVVYERWLEGQPDLPVPQLLGTAVVDGHTWHAIEERGGEDLQCLRREATTAAGKSLAGLHARFWSESPATNVNGTSAEKFALVAKHLPSLSLALTELADRAASAPSTLCEDALLPMNVLWDGHDATIIDFGHADISPYFGDPARFVAFGKSPKVATTFSRQTLAKSFSPNSSRSSALCREQLSTERASTETLRSAKSPSCPSSSLHTSGERRNSLMLPRSQSLNASCNLPTPSGRTRSPRAHRGQRNCWHLGHRNELRFMKCSRTIGVPQRLHGSPSRP